MRPDSYPETFMLAPALIEELKEHLYRAYSGIEVTVGPFSKDPSLTAIHFRHDLFAGLYPQQRRIYVRNRSPTSSISSILPR